MRRIPVEPRPFSQRLVQSQGLVYSGSQDPDDPTAIYWPDDRYYSFTVAEIELIERAGRDVFDMCCEAADYLVQHPDKITQKMAIPAFALQQIVESWNREPAWGSVYGRFDVCFGGLDHPDPRLRTPKVRAAVPLGRDVGIQWLANDGKIYEFNADTPTSLVEAASIQWLWLEQTGHGNDQYNSITERLIDAWRRNMALIEEELGHKPTVFFASGEDEPSGEDAMNVTLMMDTAKIAKVDTKMISMEEIANGEDGRFYAIEKDESGAVKGAEHIDVIFKLYPWEQMVEQHFGEACFKDMENVGRRDEEGEYIGGTVWIEAPYKMLWSNKAIFAILWELFEHDPRSEWLLPTYFEEEKPEWLTKFARKPIFSREGADITLQDGDTVIQDAETGEYGKEGYIVQELAMPPEFKDEKGVSYYPVLGLWFVDGDPAGMGIREVRTLLRSSLLYCT